MFDRCSYKMYNKCPNMNLYMFQNMQDNNLQYMSQYSYKSKLNHNCQNNNLNMCHSKSYN